VLRGAAAPVLREPDHHPLPAVEPPQHPVCGSRTATPPAGQIQASLFGPQVVPRMLEIPAPRVEKRVQTPRQASRKTGGGTQAQQSLDFFPEPIETGDLLSGDAVIQCSAPVAPLALRLLASVVDASIVLCALGLMAATLSFGGVEVAFRDRTSLIAIAIAAGSVAVLYKALFVIANGDTVGVRALRMRVVDFDGRRPTIRQRVYRFFGGCLGVLAATLGLLWALVDEESLTWHDHVSKTFPTAAPPARSR